MVSGTARNKGVLPKHRSEFTIFLTISKGKFLSILSSVLFVMSSESNWLSSTGQVSLGCQTVLLRAQDPSVYFRPPFLFNQWNPPALDSVPGSTWERLVTVYSSSFMWSPQSEVPTAEVCWFNPFPIASCHGGNGWWYTQGPSLGQEAINISWSLLIY